MNSRWRLTISLTITAFIAFGLFCDAKTIKWAVMGQVLPIHRELIKRFENKTTGITVKPMGYASKDELLDLLIEEKPDIITLDQDTALEYITMSILADMAPYYKGRDEFYGDIKKEFMRNLSKRGKIYALPFWGSLAALNYNRQLFRTAGLSEPMPNWKYQNEFILSARKLTKDANGDGKKEQYGMVGGVYAEWLPICYSFGAEFLSMDGLKLLFTDKAATESLTYIQNLHKDGLAEARDPEDEFTPDKGPFADGRTAMFIDSKPWTASVVRSLQSKGRLAVGYTSTPYGPKGSISVATAQAIGLYSQSRNKEAASRFLAFLYDISTQSYIYDEYGAFPTRKSVFKLGKLQNKDRSDDPLVKSFDKARVMGAGEISQMILDGVKVGIYEMVHQGMSPQELIKQSKDQFYKMLLNKENE